MRLLVARTGPWRRVHLMEEASKKVPEQFQ